MDRSVQKRFLVKALTGSMLMMGFVVQAHAGSLLPGKWRSDFRVQINGRDSTVVMSQFAAQVRATMPTQLKSGSGVGLNAIGNMGSATVCMTPAVAATQTSPTRIFNTYTQMNPRCKLVAGTPTYDSVPFTGRCDDPFTYTGNVSGVVKVYSLSKWSATMQGAGLFPDSVLKSLGLPAKTVVLMNTTASSNLLSSSCQ